MYMCNQHQNIDHGIKFLHNTNTVYPHKTQNESGPGIKQTQQVATRAQEHCFIFRSK